MKKNHSYKTQFLSFLIHKVYRVVSGCFFGEVNNKSRKGLNCVSVKRDHKIFFFFVGCLSLTLDNFNDKTDVVEYTWNT